ncbi:MAG: hypothetical protein LBC56_05435 [Oscillospiraceae bacterium]|nr:hypothetical protein [Oscillospiraceae bacterium]
MDVSTEGIFNMLEEVKDGKLSDVAKKVSGLAENVADAADKFESKEGKLGDAAKKVSDIAENVAAAAEKLAGFAGNLGGTSGKTGQ